MRSKKITKMIKKKILLYSLILFFFIFFILNLHTSLRHLNIEEKVRRFGLENFYGFYIPEKEDDITFYWTRKEAQKILRKKGDTIHIPVETSKPDITRNNIKLKITINNKIDKDFLIESNGWKLISINLNEINDDYIRIKFLVDNPWKPADLMEDYADYRILGVKVGPIYWE